MEAKIKKMLRGDKINTSEDRYKDLKHPIETMQQFENGDHPALSA